jgi:cytochrome P450
MVGADEVQQVLRWGVQHGVVRQILRRRARTGDVGSRILIDPALRDDPFPWYERVRAQGRLVATGIAPTSVDHAFCTAVLRSPDFGTAARMPSRLPVAARLAMRAGRGGPLNPADPPSMLAVDPPDHTRYRKLVARAFSARAIASLRERVEEIAEELLDAIAARGGTVDLVAEYASLLPATVISEMLGAPVAMRRQFLEWGAGTALALDPGLTLRDFRRGERDLAALQAWMTRHFADVRRSPGDDILSALVGVHDEGQGLTDDELTSIAMLLLAAGFETTVNLLGNGAALLAGHPEQLAALRAGDVPWGAAVDEVLRFDSPVQRTARIAHRDAEVDGERVGAGQLVVLILGGANRDPAVFADPQLFDIARADADRHVAFSQGIHYCLGAGLARTEGEIGLRALFRRFPDLALAGPPHRRATRLLRGYDAMPVTRGAGVPPDVVHVSRGAGGRARRAGGRARRRGPRSGRCGPGRSAPLCCAGR